MFNTTLIDKCVMNSNEFFLMWLSRSGQVFNFVVITKQKGFFQKLLLRISQFCTFVLLNFIRSSIFTWLNRYYIVPINLLLRSFISIMNHNFRNEHKDIENEIRHLIQWLHDLIILALLRDIKIHDYCYKSCLLK